MAAELTRPTAVLTATPRAALRLISEGESLRALPRLSAGIAFAHITRSLQAGLIHMAMRRADVDPRLGPYVDRHVALHVSMDSPRRAFGLFCGDSITVYGDMASEIRVLLHRIQGIPQEERAAHLLETVGHELVHAWAHMLGIKSTSRGGRYHPKRFGALAEALGMVIEPDPPYGLRTAGFTDAVAKEYVDLLADIDQALVIELAQAERVVEPTPAADARDAVALPSHISGSCACTPPRTIRMTRAQWALGTSRCDVCRQVYVTSGTAARQQPVGVIASFNVAGQMGKGSN